MKDVHNSAQRLLIMTIHVTAGCILFYNNYYLHVRRGKIPSKVITVAVLPVDFRRIPLFYLFRDE